MPSAFLDVLGGCRQPPVYLPAFIERHLGVQRGPQEGMGEPQFLAVALDDAGIDSLVDHRPGLPVAACRADQPFARIGGGSDQTAHPPDVWRQLAHAPPHETTETLRDRERLIGEGHARMLEKRAGDLQGIERVSAARLIQPREGVPGQHGPQP